MIFTTDVVRVRIYLALAALSDLGCTPVQGVEYLSKACAESEEDTGVIKDACERLSAALVKADKEGGTLADAAASAFGRVLAEERAVLSVIKLGSLQGDAHVARASRAYTAAARLVSIAYTAPKPVV